ncbi:MAG: hypothetical protein ACUVWO_04980 [Thermodesulfobacteriota bacterium]
MAEHVIRLTDQEVQRVQAIIVDRDKDEALRFLVDVIKEKLKTPTSRACGPTPV